LRFTIILITRDNGEKFVVELENAFLTNIQGNGLTDWDSEIRRQVDRGNT